MMKRPNGRTRSAGMRSTPTSPDPIVLPGVLEALAETKMLIVRSVSSLSPADSGHFGPGSISWRVFSHASYGASGVAAVLVQALHPVAMAAVDQNSAFRTNAWRRAHLTADYVFAITFSSRAVADAAAARVRRIHGSIQGIDPGTGAVRRADEPELLLWVHAVHTDYALRGYEALVTKLAPKDADRFVAEQSRAAELVGLDRRIVPRSVAELRAYVAAVPGLAPTVPARQFAQMLRHARMPLTMRPFWALHLAAAAALLPASVRADYQMERWVPGRFGFRAVRMAFWLMNYAYLLFGPVRDARRRLRDLERA